jgi:hypothetical protein
MTGKEIVQALRCCAEGECKDCAMHEDTQRCQENLLDKAAEAIERLTAENAALREKQRWIPVTERMPELEVPVLVLDRRGNMIVRTLRRLVSDKEAVFRPDGLAPRKNITHWMPLPGAPEAHNGKENS